MTERKSLAVHYRRMADPVGALNGVTLEAAVRSALLHQFDGVSFFGDLTVYTRGFMQALLHNEQDVAMLPVEQQPPPPGSRISQCKSAKSTPTWTSARNGRGGREP